MEHHVDADKTQTANDDQPLNISLDYSNLEPGVSATEKRIGVGRIVQIGAGVLLVLAGIAMLVLPGQGILTIVVGANMVWPDNPMVRWAKRKIPGIPENGEVPKRYLVVGGIAFVATLIPSIIWGDEVAAWGRELLGDYWPF